MKIRIKFAKSGVMKFIGHLDIMRYFQKAMRRAGIDIAYSEGFNPHQIMSFASPLGVGLTSDGEYLDIEVKSTFSSKEAVEKLNAVMVDGMKVLSYRMLSEESKNAMSIIAAADYVVSFREGHSPDIDNLSEKLEEFLNQKEIIVLKKTKKSEKETDIRPYIYSCSYENGKFFMQLSSGSANNLRPELVIEAFAKYSNFELDEFALEIHRSELYAEMGTEDEHKFVSLEDLGEEINE